MGFSRYYKLKFRQNKKSSYILLIRQIYYSVIFQTPKYAQDMFDFNTTSNLYGYLVLFVPKTLLVVWYFIIDLIPPKFHGYLALLFESKSAIIFICFCCLIIFFKLYKITQTLCEVFSSPNLNFYIVFHY